MVSNDTRKHLWIPNEEVVTIENKPTGRGKNRGVNFSEHGSKLSTGLQNIVTAYSKLQSGDSLSDEDVMVFKLILPDGEKLSNSERRKFIEAEGMIINAVKDARHAVVTAPRSLFNRLTGRVNGYKGTGRIKNFQFIDAFEPFLSEDKQASSLKQYIEKFRSDNISVDVQMMFVPKLSQDVQESAAKKLAEKIVVSEGDLPREPYRLSDGTMVIRAKVPIKMIDEISNDTVIFRMEQTRFFHNVRPSAAIPLPKTMKISPGIDISTLPVVAVLDGGVSFPKELTSLVAAHWTATSCKGGDKSHGTGVSSKVVFSNVANQLSQEYVIPRARIIDCCIMDEGVNAEDDMIHRIQEAVGSFKDIVKIFNLSANQTIPIDGDAISLIGYEIDALQNRDNVKFVISSGNHELCLSASSLEEILDDDDARIAAPADAMLGITVGAIAGIDHPDSHSRLNFVTPYSRIGPGFAGFRKPDLVAYGATCLKSGRVIPTDPYAFILAPNGQLSFEAGTSFTAPVVAGDLAEIIQIVPEKDVLLAETLLYHGAHQFWGKDAIDKDTVAYLGNCYGRGLSDPEVSKYSSPYRVTFVHSGELNRKTKQHVKFHVPTVLAQTKGNNKARVTVTCITQPPIDNTKGTDYLGAYVSASLHKLDGNGNADKSCNPSVTDGRKKWDTCFHFERMFSRFQPGSWEIWLELFTRWDIEDEQNIPYALAITVEDMTQSNDIYNEILIETQGRFQAMDTVRIPIKI